MTASAWGPDSPADDARGAVGLPSSSSVAARTPVPEGEGTPEERTDDLSPETVAALVTLARVIDPEVCDGPDRALPVGEATEVWRRQDAALLTARRLWEAGYRPQPTSGPRAPGDFAAEQAMARVMDPNAHDDTVLMHADRRVERLDSALAHAIAAVDAGYRLVSEDDATVDRIVRALHDEWCGCEEGLADHRDGYQHNLDDAARAAVRALREAGQ